MLARARPYLEILRPHNMLAAALAVFTGFHAAGGPGVAGAGWLASLCALATGAGNIANDVFDADIDRVNKPRRPIPSGRLSKRAAFVWYAVVSLAVTVLALANVPHALATIVLTWQAALLVYARWLKRMWPAGNLTVATIAASALYGGAMAAGDTSAAVLPMTIVFAFVLCREMVKGIEDVAGDRAAGARTLAVVAGKETASRVAAAAMLLVAAGMPLPGVADVFGAAYAWIMLATVVPALIAGALIAVRSSETKAFASVSRLLKLAMFAGLVAIVAGT